MDNVTITSEQTDNNPHMGNFSQADHYKVTLKYQGRQMTLHYSKGYGHNGVPPTAEEVLECLFQDAQTVRSCRDFLDWCEELGFDADRSAEKTYNQTTRQSDKLARLLGDDYQAIEEAVDEKLYAYPPPIAA